MRNYFTADLHRIFGRTPRLITMALICIGCAAVAFFASRANEDSLLLLVPLMVDNALVTVIGLLEMGCVYGDDFKSKSMQIGIGSGICRTKIVFAKMLQLMTVSAIDLTAIFFCRFAGTFLGTFRLGAFEVNGEFCELAGIWIQVVVLVCLVSFIMYFFQNTTIAVLAFLLLNYNILDCIVTFMESVFHVSDLQLENYMVSGLLDEVNHTLGTSSFSVSMIFGIAIYTFLGMVLACIVYKHRELEF